MFDIHCHYFGRNLLEDLDAVLVECAGPDASIERFYESDSLGISTEEFDERVRLMDEWKLDASVLSFPAPDAFVDADVLSDPETYTAVSRVINDHFERARDRYPDRLFGFASVPLVAGDAAVTELERAICDLGLQGVAVDSNVFGRSLTDPVFSRFFRRANELGVTVFVHPNNPPGAKRMAEYYGESMIGFPMETTLLASKLIFSGFLDRYQDLDIVLSHLGGALPYLKRRLEFLHDPDDEAFGRIERPPAAYLEEFWYDTAMTFPRAISFAHDLVGDRLLFGSDYPFGPDDAVETTRTQIESLDGPVGGVYERNGRSILANVP